MSKLQELIAKAVSEAQKEITESEGAVAKSPNTSAPKPAGVVSGKSSAGFASLNIEQKRLAEVGFIAKMLRGGDLQVEDAKDLDERAKAIGVTTDITNQLPSGFTAVLLRDIQEALNVGALFPYRDVTPGKYDSIALDGITAYLTSEATAGTESAEAYGTFIYLVEKVMAVVKKSYEAIDDSMIPLAEEVRNGIKTALAEAIEDAIVNGDNTATHMDDGVAASSFKKAFRGLRFLGLNKATVDFTGAAITDAVLLGKIKAMQLAGGKYLSQDETKKGNVVWIVDDYLYYRLREMDGFLTKEKAGNLATLFGKPVDSIFGIKIVTTSYFPTVDATGVIHATPANNTLSTCIMLNISTFRYFGTGTPVVESDKDIQTQFYRFTGSLRVGAASVFDSDKTSPNNVDATRANIVAGINIFR